MANFILLSAILFGTASFVSFTAAGGFAITGLNWAGDMCFCDSAALPQPAADGACSGRIGGVVDRDEIRVGLARLGRSTPSRQSCSLHVPCAAVGAAPDITSSIELAGGGMRSK
jgi:hypothetical protein